MRLPSENELIAAHEADDYPRLVGYYMAMANRENSVDARCFYLTFAYVFALEADDLRCNEILKVLQEHGREP